MPCAQRGTGSTRQPAAPPPVGPRRSHCPCADVEQQPRQIQRIVGELAQQRRRLPRPRCAGRRAAAWCSRRARPVRTDPAQFPRKGLQDRAPGPAAPGFDQRDIAGGPRSGYWHLPFGNLTPEPPRLPHPRRESPPSARPGRSGGSPPRRSFRRSLLLRCPSIPFRKPYPRRARTPCHAGASCRSSSSSGQRQGFARSRRSCSAGGSTYASCTDAPVASSGSSGLAWA